MHIAVVCLTLFNALLWVAERASRVSSVVESVRLNAAAEGLSFAIALGWTRALWLDPLYLSRNTYLRPMAEWIGRDALLVMFAVLTVVLGVNIGIRLWRGPLYRFLAQRRGYASLDPPPLSRWGCVAVFCLRLVGYMGAGFTWVFLWDLNTSSSSMAGALAASPYQELLVGIAVVCGLCAYNAADRFAKDWQRSVEAWQQGRAATAA